MEVMIQSSNMETFNFSNGTMSSPYLSPPSSPKRFGEYYLSAPSSPSRLSELYSQIDYLSIMDQTSSTNKNNNVVVDDDVGEGGGFAFFVNHDESKNSSTRSAEELFHGGKIKPFEETKVAVEPRKQQNNVGVGFGDERRGRERERERERDRERTKGTDSSLNNSGRRVTRSHSPYRKSNYTFEVEEQNFQQKQQPRMIKEESKSSSSKGSRRWKLSDLLLFRSASEGRGSNKDPLKKHFVGYKKNNNNNNIEEVKGSSFRSSDSFSNNGLRKKGQVSAHEMHYAMKKAESQDMKKRTFLPYRQGILGRLSGFGL